MAYVEADFSGNNAPGVYLAVEGDYSNNFTIPSDAEQIMITKQVDADGCLNGEVQMLLTAL